MRAGAGLCALALLSGGCSLFGADHRDLEAKCRAEGRVIVHNATLWREYVKGSDATFAARQKEFPETGRNVNEYAEGFDVRFGTGLATTRSSVKGRIVREDIYIVKNGTIAGRFVDFAIPAYGFGGGVFSCTGLFPDIYRQK